MSLQKDSRGVDFDPRFARLSNPDTGEVFQVLAYNEDGDPIDWDESATAAARDQYFPEHSS